MYGPFSLVIAQPDLKNSVPASITMHGERQRVSEKCLRPTINRQDCVSQTEVILVAKLMLFFLMNYSYTMRIVKYVST